MTILERIEGGLDSRRMVVFMRVLSVAFLLGALAHVGSNLGLIGPPYSRLHLVFRIWDVLMIPVDLTVVWGLWTRRGWAVFAWLAAVLLFQALPIMFFLITDLVPVDPLMRTSWLYLLATHAILITLFFLLLPRQRKARPFGLSP